MTWSRPRRAGVWGERSTAGARGRARGDVDAAHRLDAPGSSHARRLAFAGALASAPALLAGCSLLSPTPAATVTVTPSPSVSMHDPSADPTPTSASPTTPATTGASAPATPPPNVSTLSGGNGTAIPFVLAANKLPAGFTVTTPRDTGGYRMTVCGVDLEPNNPVDAAQARWQQSPSGPFLEQHVRVYADDTAKNVVGRLRAAIPGCRTYAQGTQTFRVTPIKVPGATGATATWRQSAVLPLPTPTSTSTATASPTATGPAPTATLTQDVAVVQRGKAIELLVSYAVDASPQPGVVAAAVKAAQGR